MHVVDMTVAPRSRARANRGAVNIGQMLLSDGPGGHPRMSIAELNRGRFRERLASVLECARAVHPSL